MRIITNQTQLRALITQRRAEGRSQLPPPRTLQRRRSARSWNSRQRVGDPTDAFRLTSRGQGETRVLPNCTHGATLHFRLPAKRRNADSTALREAGRELPDLRGHGQAMPLRTRLGFLARGRQSRATPAWPGKASDSPTARIPRMPRTSYVHTYCTLYCNLGRAHAST